MGSLHSFLRLRTILAVYLVWCSWKLKWRFVWFGLECQGPHWLLNVWGTAGRWAPGTYKMTYRGGVRCLAWAIPLRADRVLALNLVSRHSALKEGRPLRVKIGLWHHENCVIFYQWVSERGGGSGQCETQFWPVRSKGNRLGWWVLENFFLSGKKKFLLPSILLYEDMMSGALAAILQSLWLKDKARMPGPARGQMENPDSQLHCLLNW